MEAPLTGDVVTETRFSETYPVDGPADQESDPVFTGNKEGNEPRPNSPPPSD
jgi:hypothetical protein